MFEACDLDLDDAGNILLWFFTRPPIIAGPPCSPPLLAAAVHEREEGCVRACAYRSPATQRRWRRPPPHRRPPSKVKTKSTLIDRSGARMTLARSATTAHQVSYVSTRPSVVGLESLLPGFARRSLVVGARLPHSFSLSLSPSKDSRLPSSLFQSGLVEERRTRLRTHTSSR